MTTPSAGGTAGARYLVAAGAAILDAAARDAPELSGASIEAVGWATVDLDRANEALDAADVAGARAGWRSRHRDAHLGAKARTRLTPLGPGGPALVLLEPDTEGRLAAALARHGEHVAAIYVSGGRIPEGRRKLSGAAVGPFGPTRRLLDGSPDEPEVLVLARALERS